MFEKRKRDLCICYKCIPKHTWKHMYILPWTHINIGIHVYTNNRPPEVAEHRSTFRTALLGFAIPWIIACSHLRMNIYVCIYTHNSCLREPCIHSPFCCLTRMCLFVNKYMPTLTYTCVYIYVFTQQMPEGSRAQIYLFVALLECTCAGARAVFHCSPTAWICWAPSGIYMYIYTHLTWTYMTWNLYVMQSKKHMLYIQCACTYVMFSFWWFCVIIGLKCISTTCIWRAPSGEGTSSCICSIDVCIYYPVLVYLYMYFTDVVFPDSANL